MTETTTAKPRRWGRLLAVLAALAALGTVALAGTSLAAGNDAGSDTEPVVTADEADADETDVESDEPDPETDAEIAAWEAYDACMQEAVGDEVFLGDLGDQPDFDDEAIAEHFAALDEATEACRAELPEDIRNELAAMDEAWESFDECLADAGLGDDPELDFGGVVTVATLDGVQIIEFGDEAGSVTISGTDGDLTVETDGAVDVFDESDLEELFEDEHAAIEACEGELPEDVFGFGPGDHGDFDIEVFDGPIEGFGGLEDLDIDQLEELFGDGELDFERLEELFENRGETVDTATA